jgi:hypothetical protein
VPPTPKEARAALFTAIFLCLMGSFGILQGQSHTSRSADPPGLSSILDSIEATMPADRPVAEQIVRAQWDSDARRPLGYANIMVSIMLIAGGLLLIGRRVSTLWWIKNSVAANIVFLLGQTYDRFRVLDALDDLPSALVTQIQASWLFGMSVSIAIHVGALILVLRKSVRAYLESEGPPQEA